MADITLYSPLLWKEEGGFTNNPADPGGATNHGVTLDTYGVYCAKTGKSKPRDLIASIECKNEVPEVIIPILDFSELIIVFTFDFSANWLIFFIFSKSSFFISKVLGGIVEN